MSEDTAIKPTKNKDKNFIIIKPGFYVTEVNSIVRLVPKESAENNDHKVKVLIFDETLISNELANEIAKDRGWDETLWKKFPEKINCQFEFIQRKLTEHVKNSLQFDDWKFVSRKYFPLKKCVEDDKLFRTNDMNQILCTSCKDKKLNDLKAELATLAQRIEEPECNIKKLWEDVTAYKNKVITLHSSNQISARPYRNMRKEIQDIYNKAVLRRDILKKEWEERKKEWEEKKGETKKQISDIFEEIKGINDVSHANEKSSLEAINLLKNTRQKIKTLETEGLLPEWGARKLLASLNPISKYEEEKKQKELTSKKELFAKWNSNSKNINDKIQKIDLLDENHPQYFAELVNEIKASREADNISERDSYKLVKTIEDRLAQVKQVKEKSIEANKNKEKLLKKLENSTLKEIRVQFDKVNIGFVYNKETHEILSELLKALEKVTAKKEEIDSTRKQITEKIKTIESLKSLYGV